VSARIELLGVPTNSSGDRGGVARGPSALRDSGLVPRLATVVEITDAGDVPLPDPVPVRGPSGLLAEDALIAMIGQVSAAVKAARRRGRLPLVLGGDCPVLLGALAALQAGTEPVGLAFVDGHEDAWPPLASPTGEAADCELGLALRLFDAGLDPRLRQALPTLRPEHVAAFGPRDHDELAQANVASLTGRLASLVRPADLPPSQLPGTARVALAALPRPWWLHVDLDVLATTQLAAVDYPQPGGLSWGQLQTLSRLALTSEGCAGWSVCIYNPDLDPGRDGADAIISYITQAITASDLPAR
jgi:arginase